MLCALIICDFRRAQTCTCATLSMFSLGLCSTSVFFHPESGQSWFAAILEKTSYLRCAWNILILLRCTCDMLYLRCTWELLCFWDVLEIRVVLLRYTWDFCCTWDVLEICCTRTVLEICCTWGTWDFLYLGCVWDMSYFKCASGISRWTYSTWTFSWEVNQSCTYMFACIHVCFESTSDFRGSKCLLFVTK